MIQKFEKNLDLLKNNLKIKINLTKLYQKLFQKMDIEEKEIYEETPEKEKDKEQLNNQQHEKMKVN